MYESLTSLLPKMNTTDFGKWIIDKDNAGSLEHQKHFPYVAHRRVVRDIEEAVYSFIDQHKEMELTKYCEILMEAQIEWEMESMRKADVSSLNGKTVAALLVGAIRAERFCDGALLGFCEDGSITKWLERLQKIDLGDAEE